MADLEQQLLTTDPEVLGLQRQRQLANLLTGQAFNQPQGQMISGHYVKPSALQQALPMINAAIGGLTNANLDEKEVALAKALQQRKAAASQQILGAALGEELPAQAGPMPNGGNIPIQRTPGDMAKALRLASEDVTGAGKMFLPSLIEQNMPKQIPEQIKYKLAQEGGFKGSFNDFINQPTEADKQRIAIDKQRLGLESARLGLEQQKLAQEMLGGKLNEQQSQAVGFGTRAKEASEILKGLEGKGVLNTGLTRSGIASTIGVTPLIGDKLEQNAMTALNWTASPDQQATLQARKNFATAVLRKESGASISPTEFADVDRIYFPQPGDSASTISQKQRARDLAINSLAVQAGPGARFIQEFKPQTEFGAKKVVNFNDLP
jgi:hypothetical protein